MAILVDFCISNSLNIYHRTKQTLINEISPQLTASYLDPICVVMVTFLSEEPHVNIGHTVRELSKHNMTEGKQVGMSAVCYKKVFVQN